MFFKQITSSLPQKCGKIAPRMAPLVQIIPGGFDMVRQWPGIPIVDGSVLIGGLDWWIVT